MVGATGSNQTAKGASTRNFVYNALTGSLGIATASPQYTLDVNGDINFTGTFRQNGTQFVASRWTAGTGNDIYRLSGNVLIGSATATGTASQPLQVTGGAYVSGNLGIGITIPTVRTEISTSDNWNFPQLALRRTASNTSFVRFITLPLGGDTAFDTGSIYGQLPAIGVNYSSTPAASSTSVGLNASLYLASPNAFQVYTNNNLRTTVDNNGNLGIGITNPTSRLQVVGNVLVSGVVTCTDLNSTSDIKLKENIQTVENALDIITDLRGVKFEWKENHKPSFGVVAQELEQVLPELVNGGETKTVNYNGIIGVMIEAIKEQQEQINTLREEIRSLKK